MGCGWNYVEYEALGTDFESRGARLSEQIELLRQYWTNPLFSFQGKFHSLTRGNINLRPNRQIPIWMGGSSEPAFRRASETGEGFIYASSFDGAMRARSRVEHHLAENGRGDVEFGHEFLMLREETPAAAAAAANRWREAGGSHATVVTMNRGLKGLNAHLDYIAETKSLIDR